LRVGEEDDTSVKLVQAVENRVDCVILRDAARGGAVLRQVSKEPVEFRSWVGGRPGLDILGEKT
jgi:hypothetical protein